MRPPLVTPDIIQAYLEAGHWSRETMVERYRAYAVEYPDDIACRDKLEVHSWAKLDAASDRLAASLVELGIDRDATALIQIPSTCREIVLRVALKKAGIIGVFAPLQWRRKELEYVWGRIAPSLIVMDGNATDLDTANWCLGTAAESPDGVHCLNLAEEPGRDWLPWNPMLGRPPDGNALRSLERRQFRFDEISLITASSGTSGLAKLCVLPEGAQMCMSRVLRNRMKITRNDNIGIFAPMSGAAGLIVWMVSWTVPCTCTFPDGYAAAKLLDLVEESKITIGTTVPVILARVAREPIGSRNLTSLRLMRVGTAAADMNAALSFERRTGCRVVVASGAMECNGFGHADVDEPRQLRLDGSVGLPLEGCRLRIEDERGNQVPAGTPGELKVTAPFSSSGYWNDPEATAAVWSDGWYATGDIGVLDETGRLTLLGRLKDVINRSGHKILPGEVEKEISRHPDVIECAVAAAPDDEYGEVPWAFVQLQPGRALDTKSLIGILRENGLASYKIPKRFIGVAEFPRISGNKVNKTALMRMAIPD